MTDAEYCVANGNVCPYCRAEGELEGRGSMDMDNGTEVTVEIDCLACGASFLDVYCLVGYMANPNAI